jgi:hypothetical protein
MTAFKTPTEAPGERDHDDAHGRGLQQPEGMSIPADEWKFILEAATNSASTACLEIGRVPAGVLRRLTASHGVDHATAVAYAWLLGSPDHGPFINAFCTGAAAGPCPEAIRAAAQELTVLVVPGAFYEEYPQTGAGGESLIRELESLGIRVHRIPTLSTGTLEQNTAIVRKALREHADRDRIVVSLSRGGAEIKCALRDDPESLRGVSLWVSVGGVLAGSPLIDWVRDRPLLDWLNWLIFRWRGRNYRCFTELARGAGGSLGFDFRVPDHVEVIHVIGFPLGRHATTRYARNWHARFAARGPNDGVMLHEDVLQYPGRILPLWGADHYASDRWDFRFLAAGILRRWHSIDRERCSAIPVACEP